MPPKTKISKVAALPASKLTYKDMIKSAIITLKERNGSSRQGLKKYVQSNYKIKAANFDALFNTALRKGVESGDFLQPKGPSGPVKLAKKDKLAPVEAKITKPTKPATKTVRKTTTKKRTTKMADPKTASNSVSTSNEAVAKKPVTKKPIAKKPAANKITNKVTKNAAPKKATAKKVIKTATKEAPAKRATAKKSAKKSGKN